MVCTLAASPLPTLIEAPRNPSQWEPPPQAVGPFARKACSVSPPVHLEDGALRPRVGRGLA